MPLNQPFAKKPPAIPPAPPKRPRLVIVLGLGPLMLAGFLVAKNFANPARALDAPRKFSPTDIKLADGYTIEPVIEKWRIYPSNGQPMHASGPLIVQPPTPQIAGDRPLETGDMIGSYMVMAIMVAPSLVLVLGGLIIVGFAMLAAWQILRGLVH